MTIAMHTCRGNFKSAGVAEGGFSASSRPVPQLESKDSLKKKIEQAAKYVPLENLCLSTQCGVSSAHHGNKVTPEEQWQKLGRVVEVAREVW